jgi:hypothetical protein
MKSHLVCAFWIAVLLLLIYVLYKSKSAKAEKLSDIRAPLPYSAGATMRVEAQENSTPYLQSDIVYLDQMKAEERRKMENEAAAAAAEAARDQAALQGAGTQVGGDAVGKTAMATTAEFLRGSPSVDGVERRTIHATEKLTATREGVQMWLIGDDISELKHEVAAQSPDLSPNRWTLQLQNQVSDINTDSIEGRLTEDVLFQRHLANM